jgi:hypothetical protein
MGCCCPAFARAADEPRSRRCERQLRSEWHLQWIGTPRGEAVAVAVEPIPHAAESNGLARRALRAGAIQRERPAEGAGAIRPGQPAEAGGPTRWGTPLRVIATGAQPRPSALRYERREVAAVREGSQRYGVGAGSCPSHAWPWRATELRDRRPSPRAPDPVPAHRSGAAAGWAGSARADFVSRGVEAEEQRKLGVASPTNPHRRPRGGLLSGRVFAAARRSFEDYPSIPRREC